MLPWSWTFLIFPMRNLYFPLSQYMQLSLFFFSACVICRGWILLAFNLANVSPHLCIPLWCLKFYSGECQLNIHWSCCWKPIVFHHHKYCIKCSIWHSWGCLWVVSCSLSNLLLSCLTCFLYSYYYQSTCWLPWRCCTEELSRNFREGHDQFLHWL